VSQVDWKLTRGKWRPKLLDYAKSHSAGVVKDATVKAFNLVPSSPATSPAPEKVKEAIQVLSELKVHLAFGLCMMGIEGAC
jgi:hypothetical protein